MSMISLFAYVGGLLEKYTPFRYPVKPYQEEVSKDLRRGSRVDKAGIVSLIGAGFGTIVDLCAEQMPDEKYQSGWPGIRFVHIPIIDSCPPTKEQANQFLDLFKDKQFLPAYVHCEAGQGRTGCMVALYRIWIQNWTVEDALKDGARHKLVLKNQINFIRTFRRS